MSTIKNNINNLPLLIKDQKDQESKSSFQQKKEHKKDHTKQKELPFSLSIEDLEFKIHELNQHTFYKEHLLSFLLFFKEDIPWIKIIHTQSEESVREMNPFEFLAFVEKMKNEESIDKKAGRIIDVSC